MKYVLSLAAGIILSDLLIPQGWDFHQKALGNSLLPPPKPAAAVPPDNGYLLLATALQKRGPADTTLAVTVDPADQANFRDHLFNLAPQQGWYAHNSNYRHDVQLVIPRADLPEIEQIAIYPTGWTLRRLANPTPPAGPASTDLINVHLDIRNPHTHLLYAVSGALLWIIVAFTTGLPTLITIEHLLNRRRRQASAGSPP